MKQPVLLHSGAILLHVQPRRTTKRNHNKQIGDLGEAIAAKYLIDRNFVIVTHNFLKKFGEIDIVARGTDDKLHFIEVKSVSYETRQALDAAVTRETWRPEEKVDAWKLYKISLAIEAYLTEYPGEWSWQIDIAAIRLVPREKYAQVKLIENVIL